MAFLTCRPNTLPARHSASRSCRWDSLAQQLELVLEGRLPSGDHPSSVVPGLVRLGVFAQGLLCKLQLLLAGLGLKHSLVILCNEQDQPEMMMYPTARCLCEPEVTRNCPEMNGDNTV